MTRKQNAYTPVPRAQWVKQGDRCMSPVGMHGTVLRVLDQHGGLPAVKVQWENGFIGNTSITLLRKADEDAEQQ